jgi:predicted dehydrogenase/threonine dehydrogenase-like Zn-dependent dehydrogenase
MAQLMQHLRTGKTHLMPTPAPALGPHDLWIQSERTLISAGTERMLVSFGKANMVQKARQQPEKLAQVIAKMHTEGVAATLEKVRNKLDTEIPLGYCQTGLVHAVGREVRGIRPGDRVISNAPHAEWASVPKHLCARVPESVPADHAVFTVLASIALHGIRLLQPTLGETVVVSGLGLVGLMAVPLLRAQGCKVIALDFDPTRLALAAQYGAQVFNLSDGEPMQLALELSDGHGVDAVLICAATDSDAPLRQAAEMCRKRGRIVLTGVVGMQLSRDIFYKKELSFQVSCSYGPGRYDTHYEQAGLDYPIAHVRWTEQRNFATILSLMEEGALDPSPLITHRFAFADIASAYALLTSDAHSLGIVIDYPASEPPAATIAVTAPASCSTAREQPPVLACIGAGAFATGKLIPEFIKAGACIKAVVSKSGVSAAQAARRHDIGYASSDIDAILHDDTIHAVLIATPHHSHAAMVERALQAGKHVYVEKPLALSHAELASVIAAHQAAPEMQLMVGFNRRFAPHVRAAKAAMQAQHVPFTIVMHVNAGMLPADHWTRDPAQGGRLIGEGCHFVDLACFLAESAVVSYHATPVGGVEGAGGADGALIHIAFANGCSASIHYIPDGHARVSKERIELHGGGKSILIDNFRRLHCYGIAVRTKKKLRAPDKGHAACIAAFLSALQTGEPAASVQSLIDSSALTLRLAAAHDA